MDRVERVEQGKRYWYVTPYYNVSSMLDNRGNSSNKDYETGNYYLTVEEALEQAQKDRTFFHVSGCPEIY